MQMVWGVSFTAFNDWAFQRFGMTTKEVINALGTYNMVIFADFYIRSVISPKRVMNRTTRNMVSSAFSNPKDRSKITLHMTLEEAMNICMQTRIFRETFKPR